MDDRFLRRDVLKLLSIGGVVFASGLGCGTSKSAGSPLDAPPPPPTPPTEDFFFLQISDTHWGYRGAANPAADTTLPHAIATLGEVALRPDFVVFTGDLTHTTDDASERRARMAQFKEIVGKLAVKDVRFLPGEHDAAPDHGEAFREAFGPTHWSFDHKGVHFVAIDNVSDAAVGRAQLDWLGGDLGKVAKGTRVVVLTHRPLFDLAPAWDWATSDGAEVMEVLRAHDNVTVFYGHIHQEHHLEKDGILHHAARSLIFPLPAPMSAPKKSPLPWDAASADHGLGWRAIDLGAGGAKIRELAYR
jgi:Calcineurin-like phosphoesterase